MKSWTVGNTLQAAALVLTMITTLIGTQKPASIEMVFWTYLAFSTVLLVAIFWTTRSERKKAEALIAEAERAARDAAKETEALRQSLQFKLEAEQKASELKAAVLKRILDQTRRNPGEILAFAASESERPAFEELVQEGLLIQDAGRYRLRPPKAPYQ